MGHDVLLSIQCNFDPIRLVLYAGDGGVRLVIRVACDPVRLGSRCGLNR